MDEELVHQDLSPGGQALQATAHHQNPGRPGTMSRIRKAEIRSHLRLGLSLDLRLPGLFVAITFCRSCMRDIGALSAKHMDSPLNMGHNTQF